MEQYWKRLERHLTEQQESGGKIDSVVDVAVEGRRLPLDRGEDKVVIRFSRGSWEVAPYTLAKQKGVPGSRHSSMADAIAAARRAVHAAGLCAVGARYGKKAVPVRSASIAATTPAPPPAPSPALPTAAASMPSDGTADAFVAFAREHLRDILDVSGQVLYSGASTLRRGEVYLLGLNPGGNPANPALMTIRKSLDRLVSDAITASGVRERDRNSYVHDTWKGRNTLQRRIVWLLQALGLDPLAVTASNLIFPRSRDEKRLESDGYVDICWAVHERLLDIVQPRWVLTYGNTPYRLLGDRFGVRNEQRFPSGHGDWECRSFEVPGRFRVVRVPHMSLYAIDHHPEVVDWIRRL